MKLKSIAVAIAAGIAALSITPAVRADTVPAHCDIYYTGEDYPGLSSNCTFSQRQGHVGVQLQNGTRYEFDPVGDQPGNYVDQYGNAIYRQSGLGEAGQIFQLPNGSNLYVYWDTSSSYGSEPIQEHSRVATLAAYARGSQINLRSAPTVRSRANGYGLAGDQVNILECQQDTDTAGSDLNWCQVQFLQSGAIGWIRSGFIIFPSDGE